MALVTDPRLTPEMIALLKPASEHSFGYVCAPVDTRKHRPVLTKLVNLGFVFWASHDAPRITESGRKAMGGKLEWELLVEKHGLDRYANDAEEASASNTVMDYSRRKNERIAMMFVVHGESPASLRISTDGNQAKAQNLYRNTMAGKPLIVITQRKGAFVLAHLPGFMVIKFKLTQTRVPVLDKSVDWTSEQISAWRSMRPELVRLRNALDSGSKRFRRRNRNRIDWNGGRNVFA